MPRNTMPEIVEGLVCPFTRKTKLRDPGDFRWAGNHKDEDHEHVVYYFPLKYADEDGLNLCLSGLMNEPDIEKVERARRKLESTGQIKIVEAADGEKWYFVRLPMRPPQPTIADLILSTEYLEEGAVFEVRDPVEVWSNEDPEMFRQRTLPKGTQLRFVYQMLRFTEEGSGERVDVDEKGMQHLARIG